MLIPYTHAYTIGAFFVFYLAYCFLIAFYGVCLIRVSNSFIRKKTSTAYPWLLSTWPFTQRRIDRKRKEILADITWDISRPTYYPSIFKRALFLWLLLAISVFWWLIMSLCYLFPDVTDEIDKLLKLTDFGVLLGCQVTIIGLFVPLVVSAVTSIMRKQGQGLLVGYYYKHIHFSQYLLSSILAAIALMCQALLPNYIDLLLMLWFALNLAFSSLIIFQSVSLFIPEKLTVFVRECIANELVEQLARQLAQVDDGRSE